MIAVAMTAGTTTADEHGCGRTRGRLTYTTLASPAVGRVLPFVIGVIGDFSGAAGGGGRFADRRFIEVDPENCDAALAKIRPRLELRASTSDSMPSTPHHEAPIELEFASMADFDPAHLVRAHGSMGAALLDDPQFLRLEGTWRGLKLLADAASSSNLVQIRLISVTKRELRRDFARAPEQNRLRELISREPFERPDGAPFGLLICDFDFADHADDVDLLTNLCEVAAAAHSPLVAGASAALMSLSDWSELQGATIEAALVRILPVSPERQKWRLLRESDDADFLVLTMPRALGRPPYDGSHRAVPAVHPLPNSTISRLPCWMSAAYVLAERVIAAFIRSEWAADFMEGEHRVSGALTGVGRDRPGLDRIAVTEVDIEDRHFPMLAKLGLVPLLRHREGRVQLSGVPTFKKPADYLNPEATQNLALMATLQAVLAVSRFMLYVRMQCIEVDEKTSPADLERRINVWLRRYAKAGADPPLVTYATLRIQKSQTPGTWLLLLRLAPTLSGGPLSIQPRFIAPLPQFRRHAQPVVQERMSRASTLLYAFTCDRALEDLSASLNARGPWQWTRGEGAYRGDYLGTTATPYQVVLRIYLEAARFLLVAWKSAPLDPEKRDELLARLRCDLLPSVGARAVALVDQPFD